MRIRRNLVIFLIPLQTSLMNAAAMNERIWNRNFILLILSNFLMYITYYAILSALPLYLVTDLKASKIQVGIVVGVYTYFL